MSPFPEEKLHQILNSIDQTLDQLEGQPAVAAFDADGTLWNTDMGEAFFQYQIDHCLGDRLPPDPWQHYHKMKEEASPQAAYLWLAQINAGLPLEQVQRWAQESVEKIQPVPVFEASKSIIDHLLSRQVQVYIVTASIEWAVQPAAPLVGLKPENVIGIRTKVKEGLITSEPEGSITYREGKVQGLKERTGHQQAFFCAGNTEGDLPLLESSSALRLVMAASLPDNENFSTERKMLQIAKERSWFHHDYLEGTSYL